MNFKQFAFDEAAQVLMKRLADSGEPSAMTLPIIKKALDKMAVENTPTAIDAANAAIMKSVETTALDVLRCFKGHAHTMCTELGINHFSAWRDKLLRKGAGDDPKLVYKLCQLASKGAVVPATDTGNALNYRKPTSKDDVRSVFTMEAPAMYNLIISVIRAHDATEAQRKKERDGSGAAEDAAAKFNAEGELVGQQTPAVLKTRRSNTGADPKAKRGLRLGRESTETGGEYTNSFAGLSEQYGTDDDGSSEEEEDYDVVRAL